MRHQQENRNPGRSDLDLGLERRGTMRDVTPSQRASFIEVAELCGCPIAAQHIRDDERRRERVHAAPAPAPRPGPAPRPTPPRNPMLMVVPAGGGETVSAVRPETAWWQDVRRIAERHDGGEFTPPTRGLLEALRRAATTHLR